MTRRCLLITFFRSSANASEWILPFRQSWRLQRRYLTCDPLPHYYILGSFVHSTYVSCFLIYCSYSFYILMICRPPHHHSLKPTSFHCHCLNYYFTAVVSSWERVPSLVVLQCRLLIAHWFSCICQCVCGCDLVFFVFYIVLPFFQTYLFCLWTRGFCICVSISSKVGRLGSIDASTYYVRLHARMHARVLAQYNRQ